MIFFIFIFIRHYSYYLFCKIIMVIVMRGKFLIPIVLSIVIGFFFGKVFFNNYESSSNVFNEGEKVYFIQKGVYSSFNDLKKNNSSYDDFLYLEESDGYHYYVGITKNEKNAKKIKEFYEKSNINIYVREKYINNANFVSVVSEYDKLIDVASLNSFVDLQKIVISNYKEMILNGEDSN